MCGSSASTSQGNRRPQFHLSGWLGFNSHFQRAGDSAVVTHSGCRIVGKLSEKLGDPKSAVFISRTGHMLSDEQGASFRPQSGHISQLSSSVSAGTQTAFPDYPSIHPSK
ncbi:hypothetical protein ATANTOWER_011613 [Ataeniobius toweri]|uniref:Uncharacterized protein n=1 Tax=Ataeniobius toweri TaxID=208326 RepID=A0ABU7A216_9TELE|nr:hypothetical protein [Ataeniobius toweri]